MVSGYHFKKRGRRDFCKAEKAQTTGTVLFKDMENVLPLFADQAGLGGIGLCFSNEAGFCIKTGNDISGEWLLESLQMWQEATDTFSMFHLKESMDQIRSGNRKIVLMLSVAAYLLNPLKNNYTWEDVAREHLDLMVDEKADQEIKGLL